MSEHEKTIEEHAQDNFAMASDQVDDYPSLDDAFLGYSINTVDSIREDGYSDEDAYQGLMIFCSLERNYRPTNLKRRMKR